MYELSKLVDQKGYLVTRPDMFAPIWKYRSQIIKLKKDMLDVQLDAELVPMVEPENSSITKMLRLYTNLSEIYQGLINTKGATTAAPTAEELSSSNHSPTTPVLS